MELSSKLHAWRLFEDQAKQAEDLCGRGTRSRGKGAFERNTSAATWRLLQTRDQLVRTTSSELQPMAKGEQQ